MAVSKTVEPDRIREAYAAGLRVFGENRVQEFEGKSTALSELKDAEWHLIGHLQSNKAKKAAELFHAIDSVDSLRLAENSSASSWCNATSFSASELAMAAIWSSFRMTGAPSSLLPDASLSMAL